MKNIDIIKKYSRSMENVLLILHELQNNNLKNHLTEEDLKWAADYLKITYGQIIGIATYYTLFSLKARGRHIVRVCRSPVCHMMGSESIISNINNIMNINLGETTADGLFTLESTECIGHCEKAPCLSLGDTIYGDVKVSSLENIFRVFKNTKEELTP